MPRFRRRSRAQNGVQSGGNDQLDPAGTYFRKSPGALRPSRRQVLQALGAGAAFTAPAALRAQSASEPFDQWVTAFRARAAARGIPDTTYWQVMRGLKPDTTVFKELHDQPEFKEQIWQYLNRRVSDWRVVAGREKAKEYASLLTRVEKDFGVERSVMLGIWGIESAYGDPDVQQNQCGRLSRRLRHWPGAIRGVARTGSRSCSTPWSSSIAAGARLPR